MQNNKEAAEREIILARLTNGIPRLTAAIGQYMAQACAVCLDNQNHQRGVELKVQVAIEGSKHYIYKINDWELIDEKVKSNWNDLQEATEFAASGLAILLIQDLTEFTILERSVKGTGFDYWLAKKESIEGLPFASAYGEARLEVSGILSGSEIAVRKRLTTKKKQVRRSDKMPIPAYIVVIEFSNPMAQVIKK